MLVYIICWFTEVNVHSFLLTGVSDAVSRALPKHVPKKQKSTSPKKEGMAAEQSSMPDTDVSR